MLWDDVPLCLTTNNYNNGWPRKKEEKVIGKRGEKRHKKVLRDNIHPAIRLLACRGGVKRIRGLIHEETRGVLKVPWKRHLWRCHLHRARSQTDWHCHGRFLFPQETGKHSLQIRRLNIFEFKRSNSKPKWYFQHHNCVPWFTNYRHIADNQESFCEWLVSTHIIYFCACHEYDHLGRALSVLDARGPFGLMEAKPPEPQFA
jgi:hypothetical protein